MFSVSKSLALLLASCSMVGPLSANAYMPGLYAIAADFGISEAASYQTLSSYLFFFAISSLFVGAVSDALGRKPVMVGGMIAYAAACVMAALAPSYEVFMLSRILMGLFASVGTVLAMAITRDLYDDIRAQELTSLIAVIFALAPAFAPILGGWIVVLAGWRSVFWFLVFVALTLALVCQLYLTESHPKEKRQHFQMGKMIKTYGASLKNPAFSAGVLCNGFLFMGMILFSAGAPDYVAHIMKMGVTDFGYLMIPLIGFGVLGSLVCTWFTKRFGDKRTMRWHIALLIATGLWGLGMNYAFEATYPWCIVPVMIYCAAVSVIRPILTVYNLDYFPQNRGMAASIQQFFQTFAFAICAAVWVPMVMGSAWKYDAVLLLCAIVVGVFWWVILRTRPRCLPAEFVNPER